MEKRWDQRLGRRWDQRLEKRWDQRLEKRWETKLGSELGSGWGSELVTFRTTPAQLYFDSLHPCTPMSTHTQRHEKLN